MASRDGTRIGIVEHGRAYRAPGRASVLFVPALGVPIGYYADMLTRWSQAGRHIVAVEQRGMPLTPIPSIRQQRYGYSTIIRDDLPAITATLLSEVGGYVAVGHSLGGQLALLATAAGTIRPAGTATIAAGTSSPAAHTTRLGRVTRRAQLAFIRAMSAVLGSWPGDRLGFGGRQPHGLMCDWCHEGTHGRYRLHGDDTDYEAALSASTQPVLMLDLDCDPIITPPAVEHLARRLPIHSEHRTMTSIAPAGFDHIRWARRKPQPVITAIGNWIDRVGNR